MTPVLVRFQVRRRTRWQATNWSLYRPLSSQAHSRANNPVSHGLHKPYPCHCSLPFLSPSFPALSVPFGTNISFAVMSFLGTWLFGVEISPKGRYPLEFDPKFECQRSVGSAECDVARFR